MSEQRPDYKIKDQADLYADFYAERGIKHNPGFVYILKSDNGLYKIGKTKDIEKRIKTLRTASPVKIQVWWVFKSADCDETEKTLHDLFSDKREIGEWFRLSDDDLKFFDRESDGFLQQ